MIRALKAALRAWHLSAEAYRSERFSRRAKQNLRWAAAAALHPDSALEWFARLDTEGLTPFRSANPILAFKPMRTYLSTRWGIGRRTKVMRETYAYVLWRGGAAREALLQPGGGVHLATVPLGELGEGELKLGFDNRFRKEGEFAVFFEAPALGGRVCSLSFALEWQDNGLALFAGCVQGVNEGEGDLMKALGKAMHGLRPKALVVFAAQEVARCLGAREIFGAGNTIQVHRRKHLIHLSWVHELTFDYDAFWSELGGRPAFEGWFYLPRKARKRTREEIKPNKRSLYAKRYAMQDQLSVQIRESMGPGNQASSSASNPAE